MPTRRYGRPFNRSLDWIDGRRPEHSGKPGEENFYAGAPGLKAAREAQGVTLEGLSEVTGYPASYIRALEEGQIAPRIVTSRLSAVLGVETTLVRGEEAGQVARIRDVIVPGE